MPARNPKSKSSVNLAGKPGLKIGDELDMLDAILASLRAKAIAAGGPVGLPISNLAPKRVGPPRHPDRPKWSGDGVSPERETRQQRRAKARKETT